MDVQSCILSADQVPLFLAFEPFMGWLLVLMFILIFLSAFFSMSETAFSSCASSKLTVMIGDRKKGAKKALEMLDKFDKTLTTLLIGNNLVNVALSTIAVTFFVKLAIFGDWVEFASTLIVTVLLLIFGEIVPKMIAKRHPESIACGVAWIIYILSIVLFPLVMLFAGIQHLFSKKTDESTFDEDTLEVIVDDMEESGQIEADEAEYIHNVLDLNDRSVEDIMVPRIKMEAIDYQSKLDDVKEFMLNNPYSRIPVYQKDKDHIVGILYERDFFPAVLKNPKASWRKLMRPVKYVSGSMKVDALITELQATKTHIAIVSGEYGDVLGLVTMEDALEELVGEIYDEHDIPGENEIKFEEVEENTFVVDSEIFVDDLFDRLGVGEAPEDIPSKLSGWLFAKCESLPAVGFSFDFLASYTKEDEESGEFLDYNKILTISINEVESRRIVSAKIVLRDATDEEIEEFNLEEEEK